MKFFTIIPLVIAVIFQMASHAVELDPLLADAQDIGIDLANHIKVTENVAVEDVVAPTAAPTLEPTFSPTTEPSLAPTPAPSAAPTTAGETNAPSYPATTAPSFTPTASPSATTAPSFSPTASPSAVPTLSPTVTAVPSASAPVAPTIRPTRNPSFSPTAAPTVPGQTNAPSTFAPSTSAPSFGTTPILTFSSSVGVGGLDSPDLDSASQLSIAQATCTSMNLPTSSCSFTSSYESTNAPAGSPTSRRLRTQSEHDASVVIKLQSITVICVVDTVTSVPAGTDPSSYFTTLSNTLTSAVSSSTFTTNLQTASSYNNATQTVSATVNSVAASDPVIENPPSDDDDKLSDGAIAGIVIGVVVGVALIAAAVYYFFLRPSRSGYESDSTNFNAKSYGRGGADAPINL